MLSTILENKKAVVSEIKEKFETAESSIIVEYRGLNVSEMTELRRRLTAENIEFKVYKNTMMRRAVEGTDFENLNDSLMGPNAVAFGEDAVAPSRVLAEFAKKHKKLILKAGIVNGNVVDAEEVKELSTLPNHDGMISMLLGMFQSPIRDFAYVVSQVAEKREAEGDVVEEAAVEAVEETTEAVVEETVEEKIEEETTEEVVAEEA